MNGEHVDSPGGGVWLHWIGAAAVSAVLLGGVLWFGDPEAVWAAAADARTGPLVAAVTCYGLVLGARWVRLVGLASSGRGWRLELLGVSAGHSLANQLLPARSGELAFPALWRRATGDGYARGTVYLVAIRVVELGVVVPIFGVGLAAWWWGVDFGVESFGTAGVFLAAGGMLIAGLPALLRIGLGLFGRLLETKPLSGLEVLDRLRTGVPRARSAIDGLGRRKQTWLVGTTLLMWIAMFGAFYWSLAACEAGVGPVQSVVGAGGGIVGNLIPVGAVGSFGPMEAGWTAAFRATGAPVGPVVAAGLLVHGIVVAGAAAATALAGVFSEFELSRT